jgi:ADP-heptose:LPS heptosyltransferase
MHVDTMRAIDRYLGIPLTCLGTLLLKLWEGFFPPKAQPPQNILFIELSEMGSTILADPALRKARKELKAELFFVIFAQNRPSLELTATIPAEQVFTLREDNLGLLIWDTLRFLRWTRERKIDTVIDLELFSRFTALLTGASGATLRVGFYRFHNEGLYRGEMLTHRVAYNPHQHIAKNFMALVNSLLVPEPELPYTKQHIMAEDLRLPLVHFTEEEQARMHCLVKNHYPAYKPIRHRLVLINPNASDMLPQRRWPSERYLALSQRILAAAPDILLLITGSPSEQAKAEVYCQALSHSRCLNFAGVVAFRDLPLLYSLATLMVTNDSGPGHFSAITSLPTFILFGPETPSLYGSLGPAATHFFADLACSPCVSAANHRKSPCTDNKCLQAISVDEVFIALAPLLKKGTGKAQISQDRISQ